MAKSKNGGTRAFIKGRIGSDVYSVGKDGKGNRQQVVRSLAEQVSNPRTQSQMFGRMIMSTVMQAVSQLSPIIDHSFDGSAKGQPSISEFIRRNYALVKADALAHPASGNAFGLNMYQEKGAKRGAFVISDGKALIPAAAVLTAADGLLTLTADGATLTVATLKSALNFNSEDYITLVGIDTLGNAKYCRISISGDIADTTLITSGNLNDVFVLDGNATPSMAIDGQAIAFTLSAVAGNCGIIVSFKSANGYIHNACTLSSPTAPQYTSDFALPTYPVGAQLFLNGGELAGGDHSAQVVVTPMAFPLESGTGNVSLVSIQQKSGYVAGLDAEGQEYTIKCADEDRTNFGKFMINEAGTSTSTMWDTTLPAAAQSLPAVKLEAYSEASGAGVDNLEWLVAQGANYLGFYAE